MPSVLPLGLALIDTQGVILMELAADVIHMQGGFAQKSRGKSRRVVRPVGHDHSSAK